MESYAVSTINISKSFGNRVALNSVNLDIFTGELFGIIGPDGAGKTTLIRILTSLMLPDKGNMVVYGLDPITDYKELRKKIGYMPGRFSLYGDLTVRENLNFFASIYNTSVAENYDLIKDIYHQIEPFSNRRASALSGGMKQKLALSCALIHRPEILFLDEPTTGVDAVSRREFWQMLGTLKFTGITTIVSTTYMDEASRCDRVALMMNGSILNVDAPSGLIRNYDKPLYAINGKDKYSMLNSLRSLSCIRSAYPFGEVIHVVTEVEESLHDWAEKHGSLTDPITVERVNPSIEDVFLEYIVSGEKCE